MSIVVDPKAFVIGPAFAYYRDVGVSTPWTSVGPTLDDAVARVNTTWFRPDNLAGVMGPVMGLDVLRGIDAEIEFTIAEVDGTRAGLVIPGARVTAAVNADAGGGGATTLNGATVAGATSIVVASATGLSVGDYFRVEAAANAKVEYRQITSVSGTTIGFRDQLIFDHASGVAVVETTGDNRTAVEAPVVRRQPDTVYKEWALVMESGRSAPHELRLPRAISQTEAVEMTIADDALAGVRTTLGARFYGPDLTVSPFTFFAPAS
jgi:hypothetical protein